jgi:hypothetical protein
MRCRRYILRASTPTLRKVAGRRGSLPIRTGCIGKVYFISRSSKIVLRWRMNAVLRAQRPPQSCQFERSDSKSFQVSVQRHNVRRLMLTFHSYGETNGILVFHLVYVDAAARPFTVVRCDVCLYTLFELLYNFQGGVVRNCNRCTLPPASWGQSGTNASIRQDEHGTTATHVMNELRAGQQRVGNNDLLTVDPSKCGGK